ncbi:LuxR C-terminal-related transcriptional regulator [bacterium]|nr:LuxR C-terminal-related transcriptional regulator [bacterium]
MKKIILFTNMDSIKKHWQNALVNFYQTLLIEEISALTDYLDANEEPLIIMLDEMSVSNIHEELSKLKAYDFVTVLVFNALPEVYHASTLLHHGIRGYENSYIDKDNLKKMLASVEKNNNWFFSSLVNFIINKYIKINNTNEPDFMPLLTEKEKEISLMIADGLTNKEIAQKERIALSTVKGHIQHIFEKANVTDRFSLALKFK